MFNKILLAADGSEHSVRATEKAIGLAQNNPTAKVDVVYVVDSDTAKSDVLHNQDSDEIARKRQKKLHPIEEKLKNNQVDYQITFVHGEPGPSIVKYANEKKFDVVVIGSRGLSAFQEFVLGSVSHKVAKRANCPVLIVK